MLEYFDMQSDRLLIGGLDYETLTRSFRTPLYVYDAAIVRKKYRGLRSAMPAHVDIFYAVKSNSNLSVIRCLFELGAGFDVASIGELAAMERLRIPGSKVIFTGPGKSDEEIEFAIRYGIRMFNCESEREIHRIDAFAGAAGKRVDIGLRINTDYAIAEKKAIIGGTSAKKFGMDETKIPEIVKRAGLLKNIRITGLHVFNATQVLDHRELAANTKNILRLAAEISQESGQTIASIDIGGGLGIPYSEHESELDVGALGRSFEEMHGELPSALKNARWIVEPGRYLSGECGVLLATVTDVKESRGILFAITDAGIQTFLRPALIQTNHPTRVANKFNWKNEASYRVEGPLCTSLDCLGKDILLPEVKPGDTLAFFNAGAYGFAESMPYFLSHPIAAEVLVDEGKARLVRPRTEPRDYIRSMPLE